MNKDGKLAFWECVANSEVLDHANTMLNLQDTHGRGHHGHHEL